VELKNINSFRFVRKAIDSEIARQQALISAGGTIEQETRGWSEAQGKTIPMRDKEDAMDYRYFPDPDLPPIEVEPAAIEALRAALPELPAQKRARWQRELGLTAADAAVLSAHPALAELLEHTVSALVGASQGKLEPAKAGKRAANFIQAEALRHVRLEGLSASIPVSAAGLGELLSLIENGEISGKIAKEVVADMIATGREPRQIIAQRGLSQVSDASLIEQAARAVIRDSPGNVAAYRGGKHTLLGWFVGQVMKATSGRANPQLVNELLRKLLDEEA
jgi:aspartyl-tRNA(Asn)/glutamyl-tRNA(Gln) amidotransferase subunit B